MPQSITAEKAVANALGKNTEIYANHFDTFQTMMHLTQSKTEVQKMHEL